MKILPLKFQLYALTFVGLFLIGCGDSQLATHKVEGKIQFAGGGVPRFGSVEFYHPEKKINARGKIESDGTFTVSTYEDGDGAIEGDHQITVNQIVTNHLAASAKIEIQHDHGKTAAAKYRDYRTSGLKCTIVKGTNKVELKISEK